MKEKDNTYLDLLKKSYKKLKSYIFFDKTQLIIRDKIVRWETENNIEEILSSMADAFYTGNVDVLFDRILSSIAFTSFPKKLSGKTEKKEKSAVFISNIQHGPIEIDEIQYFLDMDIEGFILGVSWILVVGFLLDEKIYEHSYGNRLRKNLLDKDDKTPTYSPYLFEPYFQQYESWRDKALGIAKNSLAQEQDVVVLTLDFKRFFYQVDVKQDELMAIIDKLIDDPTAGCNNKPFLETPYINKRLARMLTVFVGKVIGEYSKKLRNDYPEIKERNVLPIGFPPSNIIANYCLNKFDEAMTNGWNPLYYGRYVDDIIIVDKVEKNSKIYKQAVSGELSADDMIDFYLLSFDAWKRQLLKKQYNRKGLLIKESQNNEDNETKYRVNSEFAEFSGSEIIVQNSKVKIFYFNSGETDALINCFQNRLKENKSEFRFLPEDESIFQRDDYSEIYSLSETDGPNKLRGVEDISIDKFDLSKFLGKYMRISGLIDDKQEKGFEKDIEKIFANKSIIENYMTWEKVISILANHENFDAIEKFINKVIEAIEQLECTKGEILNVKISLVRVLLSAIHKTFSIVWGPKVKELIREIPNIIQYYQLIASENSITKMRYGYCTTRMCDKYALILPIDCYVEHTVVGLTDNSPINLTKANDVLNYSEFYAYFDESPESFYSYYPYLISMGDLTFYNAYRNMKKGNPVSSKEYSEKLIHIYTTINYKVEGKNYKTEIPIACTCFGDSENLVLNVGDNEKQIIKVAVANAVLYESDFENVLKDTPNRSYARYRSIMKVVNEALENHSDILVMPESFLPYEWLPIIARTCAKNQMAIVSGIEHVKLKNADGENVVYNLTATILPYQEGSYKFAYIHFHSKTHFSPDEKEMIQSYRCVPRENTKNTYELYCWDDFWFPVYCCYELASIHDRALFQSYADAIIAVEWNKDTKYYSNIVESLSRDLHCYCIQVNTAKYGDSRITQPAKTEEKDLVKVKGGVNPTVLIDSIDIKGLREFQIKGNQLQAKTKSMLKQTPPDFDYDVVQYKLAKKLMTVISDRQQKD